MVEETQVPVYYPGTTELSAASPIDVRPGASADGVDLTITEGTVRTRRIRGVVLANGQPVAAAEMLAIPRTSDPSLVIPGARTGADGSFDIPGVVPGFYFLFARTNPGLTGGVALQVADVDIDNLVIPVTAGVRVTGRFVIDGRSRGVDPDMASLRAILRRDPDVIGMPEAGPTFSPPPATDGSFELQGVPAGDFRVSVRALPPDAYIKSMRMGSADVLDAGLHISGTPRDALEIVIGANAGGLAGTVVNARQDPLANVTVALVPGCRRFATEPISTRAPRPTARVDFSLRGLAAGSYTAFAWEEVEDGAWQDPDFVRSYDSQGKSVVDSRRQRRKHPAHRDREALTRRVATSRMNDSLR